MPSNANRDQIMAIVMCEALSDMLADQGAFQDDHFRAVHADLKSACDAAYPVMIADPGGGLTEKDVRTQKGRIDRFKEMAFQEFVAPEATSFCIDLVSDHVTKAKNRAKKAAFQRIMSALENLHTYFDPSWEYDAPEGYQAARVFESLR
jgi:hypothetical protein